MASSRKSSTEAINDTPEYKKLDNNQIDKNRKHHTHLELETSIKTLVNQLTLLLDQRQILLTAIEAKQTNICSWRH